MENLSGLGLDDWPFEKNALQQLQNFVSDSTRHQNCRSKNYTHKQVDELCAQLYNEYCRLIPDDSEREFIVLYTCQYLGFIRAQLNELFTYWRQTRKHFFIYGIWIDISMEKLASVICRIEARWNLNFSNLPAPEFETFDYIQATRRMWNDVHFHLLKNIKNTEIKLLAMNLIRCCRVPSDAIVCRSRIRYNQEMLCQLLVLISTEAESEDFEEQFINLLIQEEFYEEFFVTYFIDTITDLLSSGGSRNSQRQKLAPWYSRLKNAPPPTVSFTFNFHTPEELGLPAFRQLMKDILDRYDKLVNTF